MKKFILSLLFSLTLAALGASAQVGIVKTLPSDSCSTTASPTTCTFSLGNTNANTLAIGIVEGNSLALHVTAVTDGEGNSFTAVASFSDHNLGINEWHSWWLAPVTHGVSSDNVVSVVWSAGPNRVTVNGVEASNVAATSPLETSTSAGGSTTSVSYALSTAAAGDLLLTLNTRLNGGTNWSGLSGTDLTGVSSKQTELNWFASAAGTNAITATSSQASFGSSTIALKPSGSSPTNTQDIAAGTVTLPTANIADGACSAAGQVTTTSGSLANVINTDTVKFTPRSDLTIVSGYAPSTNGSLYITYFVGNGSITVKACNNTSISGGITPAGVTLNWAVQR